MYKNIRCFISNCVVKYKTWKFEKDFKMYYTGLLLGELYDAKVSLLTYMQDNKDLCLKKYLQTGQSVYRQINESLYRLKS